MESDRSLTLASSLPGAPPGGGAGACGMTATVPKRICPAIMGIASWGSNSGSAPISIIPSESATTRPCGSTSTSRWLYSCPIWSITGSTPAQPWRSR
jgi:hypothetical protein